MEFSEAQRLVQNFCRDREWDSFHNPKDLAIGLVTEASELLELFRFVGEMEIEKKIEEAPYREQIADELADSLYFILRFAQMNNFDLAECLKNKLIKNARKYPIPE